MKATTTNEAQIIKKLRVGEKAFPCLRQRSNEITTNRATVALPRRVVLRGTVVDVLAPVILRAGSPHFLRS